MTLHHRIFAPPTSWLLTAIYRLKKLLQHAGGSECRKQLQTQVWINPAWQTFPTNCWHLFSVTVSMWYSRRANALRFEMACWNKTMWFHKDSANRTNYATNAFSQKISSTKIGRFENVWNHRNHQDGLVPAMGPKPKLHEGSNRFVTFSDHVRLNVESLSLQMHYYFASCFSSFHGICSLNFFNIICSVCSFRFF